MGKDSSHPRSYEIGTTGVIINPIMEMMIVVRIFTLYVFSQMHNIESIETDPIDINLTMSLKLYVFLI